MKEKTLSEEIPVIKESIEIYRKEIQKELNKYEPMIKRLRNAIKICDERLERISVQTKY